MSFLLPSSVLIDVTAEIIKQSQEAQREAKNEKKALLKKLENASGENVFKYMNLIAFASMDEYVAQSRMHAQQSFKMSLFSALAGFILILIAIGFAIYSQIKGIESLSASYLGAVAGVIVEVISAVFFYLYAKTTSQVNRLYDRLLGSQSAYSAIISASTISDENLKCQQLIELSNKMMERSSTLDKAS